MTREEALKRLEVVRTNALIQKSNGVSEYWQEEIDGTIEAIDMAIEALSEVRCNDCKWNDDVIEVVRCKDCRHRDLFSCPLTDNDFQKDEDFCSWGERREP